MQKHSCVNPKRLFSTSSPGYGEQSRRNRDERETEHMLDIHTSPCNEGKGSLRAVPTEGGKTVTMIGCTGKFLTARDSFFGVKLRGRSLRKNQETQTLILTFFFFRVRQRYAPNVFAAASIRAIIYSKSTLISELIFALDALSHCEQ